MFICSYMVIRAKRKAQEDTHSIVNMGYTQCDGRKISENRKTHDNNKHIADERKKLELRKKKNRE